MATRFMSSGSIHLGILNYLRRDPRPPQWSFKFVSNAAACVAPECSTVASSSINLEYKFIFIQMTYIRILMGTSVLSSQKISLLVQRSVSLSDRKVPVLKYADANLNNDHLRF